MRRRKTQGYSTLTSLLDVLFILVFASLAHAAAVGEAERERLEAEAKSESEDETETEAEVEAEAEIEAEAEAEVEAETEAEAEAETEADGGPLSDREGREDLYDEAVAMVAAEVRKKHPIYVRISPAGDVTEIEDAAEERKLEVTVRLLESVPDPDVKLAYVGDRAPPMRICSVVRHHLGRQDLTGDLVIMVPEAPLESLPVALVRGLRRDQERCLRDHLGLAILVQPTPRPAPAPERSSP